MKYVFLAIFAAAALISVFRRLSTARQDALIAQGVSLLAKAKAMFRTARTAASDFLMRRRNAYRRLFMGAGNRLTQDGEIIMAHLTQFCYGVSTIAAGQADRDAIMRREGRRQVWIEILRELNLDAADALASVRNDADALRAWRADQALA